MTAAGLIVTQVCADLLAQDVVVDILPPSRLLRSTPLQEDTGLIYIGNGITWGRRGFYKMT